MYLNRLRCDEEVLGDLAVRPAFGSKLGDPAFAWRERLGISRRYDLGRALTENAAV